MTRLLRASVVPLALVGLLAVTGLALGRIYAGDLAFRLLLGAAAGSVAISAAARRLPSWAVGPLSVLGLAGYTLLTVRVTVAATGVPGTFATLTGDALANGIPRVLTAMIPVEPQPDTMVVPVLATWLTGLAAAELALRTGRILVSCLPPTLLYATVLYTVGPNAGTAVWQPLCFAGLVAMALAAGSRRAPAGARTGANGAGRPPGGGNGADRLPDGSASAGLAPALRVRMLAGAAAGLAVTLGLIAAVGPAVAGRVDTRPADPRRYVKPPQLDALDENPLVRLSGWALNPDQHLFDVKLSGSNGRDNRIRLGVLNDYDGVTWRVGATYRSAGRVLAAAGPGPAVTQHITVADLDGRLVPAMAQPDRIDGARVAFDQASGTIAIPEGMRPGTAYTVDSHRPRIDVNLLPAANTPAGPAVARFVRLGSPAPDQLRKLADQLATGNGSPYERAQAVEQFLAEHYQLVTDAPSGHAYPNLAFFLFGPTNSGGQRGTSEQFAAAFGALARIMGLPTRLVVGFRVRPGTSAVHGADALAWPEVLFDGVGWVPFNPLPQPDTQPRPVEDDFKPQPEPSTPPPSTAPTPTPAPPSVKPSAPVTAAEAGTPAGLVAAAGTSGLFLVVVLGLAVVVLLRRSQRRRRLYDGDPPGRIVGAWLEVLDALRLAGRPPPRHLAATEVADHAARAARDHAAPSAHDHAAVRPAAPPIDDLARLVNAVAFAPDGVDAGQADRAAAQATAYVDELRARRSWWRRLLWTADPRPLRWSRTRRRHHPPLS